MDKNFNVRAFTLLELLVTLAIIGVLGGFSIVTYISFNTKAQVQEAFQVLDEYKQQALYVYNSTGAFSAYSTLFADGATTNCVGTCVAGDTTDTKSITAKYITQITAKTGTNTSSQKYILLSATITASSYGIASGANQVFVQGTASNNQVTWQCIYGVTNSVASSLLPSTCSAYVA